MSNRGAITTVAAVVASLGIALPGIAYAGAIGSTAVGTFRYNFQGATIQVPTGSFLPHRIRGSDRTVTNELAGVDSVGPGTWNGGFCNWRLDLRYEGDSGSVQATDRVPVSNTCDHYPGGEQKKPRTLTAYGKACAVFYVAGRERARQCHNIVKMS